jgi:hypothetical protein
MGFENSQQNLKNDCIAAGEMIIGSMMTPDGKIGSIHIPEEVREKVLTNVMKVTSVGPDVELNVDDGGIGRKIAPGDVIYIRSAVTIPGTIDLNWVAPDQIIGLKTQILEENISRN